MPIEIRELHIKAVVDAGSGKRSEGANGSVPRSEENREENTSELIDLCVQKVLEILKEKTER